MLRVFILRYALALSCRFYCVIAVVTWSSSIVFSEFCAVPGYNFHKGQRALMSGHIWSCLLESALSCLYKLSAVGLGVGTY